MVMTDSTETSQYKELKGMIQRLTAEVSEVKKQQASHSSSGAEKPSQQPHGYSFGTSHQGQTYSNPRGRGISPGKLYSESGEPVCFKMSPTGACAVRMSSAKGSQQTTFKRETAYEQGWPIGYSQQEITPQRDATAGLVGVANESNVNLNGLTVRALIDTGATVSTVSQAFYEQHLTNLPLCQMSILNIECADGYYLPYLGYIEVNISVTPQPCLLLIVNNSNYNSKVPIILGINVMSHCLTFLSGKTLGKVYSGSQSPHSMVPGI